MTINLGLFDSCCKIVILCLFFSAVFVFAQTGNIDPVNKWAWSTTTGWINFRPANSCVTVFLDHLEGCVWGENIGWIRMGTHTGGSPHPYGNTSNAYYGVNIDPTGQMSGYAWSTNTGSDFLRITETMIPARGSATMGASYQYIDRPEKTAIMYIDRKTSV
ncbi:hypothetical protein JW935_20165 [candidate division KSB1 bacterium]|nr:hypothetical protein [candidate division KSB1 bacterium]